MPRALPRAPLSLLVVADGVWRSFQRYDPRCTPGSADAASCVTSKRGCFAFIPKYRTRGAPVGSRATEGPHSRRTLSRIPPFAAPLSLPPTPFSLLLRRVYRVPAGPPHAGASSPFITTSLILSSSFFPSLSLSFSRYFLLFLSSSRQPDIISAR